MTIGKRLKEIRKELGLNQHELAQKIGFAQPTISNLESGRNTSSKSLPTLAKALGVSAYWLETGKGEKYPNNEYLSQPPPEDEYSLIPILDVKAACGNGYFNDNEVIEGGFALPKALLHSLNVNPANSRIIRAVGNSMINTIHENDTVLINLSDREPKDGNIYAVCTPYDGLVLKRFINEYNTVLQANVWVMRSDNQDKTRYPDKILPLDNSAQIIGRAVWLGSKL